MVFCPMLGEKPSFGALPTRPGEPVRLQQGPAGLSKFAFVYDQPRTVTSSVSTGAEGAAVRRAARGLVRRLRRRVAGAGAALRADDAEPAAAAVWGGGLPRLPGVRLLAAAPQLVRLETGRWRLLIHYLSY